MEVKLQFPASDVLDQSNQQCFRQTVRSLRYLTTIQPDISFAVNKISQFMVSSTIAHWSALQHILRYLCSNPASDLRIKKLSSPRLVAFSDADWAGNALDRQSHGGHFVFLGNNLISWSSWKKSTMVRSSTETEYRSLVDAAAEVNWIEVVLQELGITVEQSSTIWCDNVVVNFLTKNSIHHTKM